MSAAFFLEIGWKSALVIALGLMLVALLRHRSAADRVFLLRLTIFLLLALPLTAAFGPTLEVEQPQALAAFAPAQAPLLSTAPEAGAMLHQNSAAIASPAPDSGLDWPFLILVAYGLGVGAVLSHLASGIWTLRQWTRAAKPVVHPLWHAAHERAAYRTGVKRPVAVLLSPDVSAPLSWGLRRPSILLDRKTVRRDEEAEAVLAHEFAHVANADWPMLILSRIMLALFWFNPLAWLLDRKLAEQSEEAADMAAVRRLDPGAYAQALLSAVSLPAMRALPATPMVASSGLGKRIHRILDDGTRNRLSGSVWTVLGGGAVLAAAAAIATLQIVPAAATAETVVAARPLAPMALAPLPAIDKAPIVKKPDAWASEKLAQAVEMALPVPPPPPAMSGIQAPPAPPAVPAPPAALSAPAAPMPPAPPALPYSREMDRQLAREAVAAARVERAEALAAVHAQRDMIRAEARSAVAIAHAQRDADRAEQRRVKYEEKWTEDAALRAMGITPAYMAEMAAAFRGRRLSTDDAAELKAMNITPDMVRGMVAAGYASISIDELQELAAMSVTPAYVRGLAAAGFRGLTPDELVELKAVGVTAEFAKAAREKGLASCAEELAELRTSGNA